jgi:hypothetical protein
VDWNQIQHYSRAESSDDKKGTFCERVNSLLLERLRTMAFSFGGASAAPSAGGGFSFGGAAPAPAAPAPAAAGGFGFGGAANPAPAAGGGFAPAPAQGTSLFGAAPSPGPAPGASLFGAAPSPAAAPGTSLFGAAPSPAPAAGGFGFGATPAPAAGGFGAAPAAGGFGFGAAPAPAAGGFGAAPALAASSPFGQAQQQPQQQQQAITSYTPYAALPDNAKRMIDQLYQQINEHRRAMYNLEHMSPALLTLPDQERNIPTIVTPGLAGQKTTLGRPVSTMGTDGAVKVAGSRASSGSGKPLPHQIRAVGSRIQLLSQQVASLLQQSQHMHDEGARTMEHATKEGAWPLEIMSARKNVTLTPLPRKANSQNTQISSLAGQPQQQQHDLMQDKLRQYQNQQATTVDWQEPIPSPYMWQILQRLEQRLSALGSQVDLLSQELSFVVQSSSAMEPDVAAGSPPRRGQRGASTRDSSTTTASQIASILQSQWDAFIRVAAKIAKMHDTLEAIKLDYSGMLADAKYHHHVSVSSPASRGAAGLSSYARGGSPAGGSSSRPRSFSDPFRKADARELEHEETFKARFAAKVAAAAAYIPAVPAAAPGVPAPAPAAAGGSLFGPPKPAGASLFGAAPAPTPGGSSLFGGAPTPAPAPGASLFGSAPVAAPAPATSLFGSTPAAAAPAPGASLFGGAPAAAPAPAAGGLFGGGSAFGAAPAPAAGGLFGGAPPAPPSVTKPKKKSSGRRR